MTFCGTFPKCLGSSGFHLKVFCLLQHHVISLLTSCNARKFAHKWINENIKEKDNGLIKEKAKKISKTKTRTNIGSDSSDLVIL